MGHILIVFPGVRLEMSSHLLVSNNSSRHASLLLLCSGGFCWLRTLSGKPHISGSLIRENYRLLQLPENESISPERVKVSYLHLAKLYHPDSGSPTADAALFTRVEEAYRCVLAHCSEARSRDGIPDKDEDTDPAARVAPQHRHYLSYEGVGSGTPSQRERQYRHFRADRAAEQVLDYRQREQERAAASEIRKFFCVKLNVIFQKTPIGISEYSKSTDNGLKKKKWY